MSTYLFTFRPPSGYAPSAATFGAWSRWQLELGARLKDRGNPGFAAAALGASVGRHDAGRLLADPAGSLDAAVALARGCPMLNDGGAVEICELTSHDERFDHWLDTVEPAMTEIAPVEVTMHVPGTPGRRLPLLHRPCPLRAVDGQRGRARPGARGRIPRPHARRV